MIVGNPAAKLSRLGTITIAWAKSAQIQFELTSKISAWFSWTYGADRLPSGGLGERGRVRRPRQAALSGSPIVSPGSAGRRLRADSRLCLQ
jgi:hypothetical protein